MISPLICEDTWNIIVSYLPAEYFAWQLINTKTLHFAFYNIAGFYTNKLIRNNYVSKLSDDVEQVCKNVRDVKTLGSLIVRLNEVVSDPLKMIEYLKPFVGMPKFDDYSFAKMFRNKKVSDSFKQNFVPFLISKKYWATVGELEWQDGEKIANYFSEPDEYKMQMVMSSAFNQIKDWIYELEYFTLAKMFAEVDDCVKERIFVNAVGIKKREIANVLAIMFGSMKFGKKVSDTDKMYFMDTINRFDTLN